MIFASPAWLFALLALPALLALEVWLTGRDRDRLSRLVSRPLWGRVVRRPDERWRLLRLALLLLGAAGVVVALARPQWGIVREKVEREGVDVVLVLDTSGSMATADVAPSRFFLARQALLQLIARLEGDRFALVAFEGEAYPLVPLTLDADALGLFLETVEPGIVPAPGTSLGVGLAKGLEAFVDQERRNKVMVLVSDGEDLEGEVEAAVRRAKEAGVVVYAVGVGTEGGQPVPDVDAEGRVTGYKRDESGGAVVSRLNLATLDAIARGTGGKAFRITPADTSLSGLASAIEGMEQKAMAREYSYRRKERFQVPLAFGLACLALGLLLPPPPLRWPRLGRRSVGGAARQAAVLLLVLGAGLSRARAGAPGRSGRPRAGARRRRALAPQPARPRRGAAAPPARHRRGPRRVRPRQPPAGALGLRARGRGAAAGPGGPLQRGRRPLQERQVRGGGGSLPRPRRRPGLAGGGGLPLQPGQQPLPEEGLPRRAPGLPRRPARGPRGRGHPPQPRDGPARAPGAGRAEEEAAGAGPEGPAAEEGPAGPGQAAAQDQKGQPDQKGQDKQPAGQQDAQNQQRPQTQQERADQRFRQEAGMPRERAMQLLDALQQNEKAEQKKLLAQKRAQKKKGKDW